MKKSCLLGWMVIVLATDCFSQSGVMEIRGKIEYANYTVPKYFTNSNVVLLDASALTRGQMKNSFVPRKGQYIGQFTKPLIPSPAAYSIALPMKPAGDYVDVDQNGKKDKGVQLFITLLGLNFRGDSYLDQLEQVGLSSIMEDHKSGLVNQGALLIYSPDNLQGFPSGLGKDKKLFTADDPVIKLKSGYTVATLDHSGKFTFSRDSVGTIDILEEKARATPDFSNQSILQSFHSLIDLLKERYAYTQLKGIDWENIRARFINEAKDADNRKDTGDYYLIIRKLVSLMKDAHVQANSYLPAVSGKEMKWRVHRFMGRLGANLTKLSDGRYVVTSVYDSTPARDAGWKFGTEIVSVNGNPIQAHIDTIPLTTSKATEESINLAKTFWALSFPVGTRVVVAFKQPGSTQIETRTMTASETDGPEITGNSCKCPNKFEQQISYDFLDNGETGYIQWRSFGDLAVTINMYEKFLSQMQGRKGLIIDMRHNTGGLLQLMYTMASYLFSADKPASMNWLDYYEYDDEQHDFVKQNSQDLLISSPVPELTYSGKVVVLVDDHSASAGEYFPQFLQRMNRATVIGEYATEGAGGTLSMVTLPGPIPFTFTGGRTYFTGTREVNLEGKGVQPNIRVPVSLENEAKKKNCGDPVLETAIRFIQQSK